MTKKRTLYVGDFETTTQKDDLRVWASCLVNIDTLKTDFISNNIDDFIEFLATKNSVVYFHNLKFDGEFILHYLLTHGYVYSEKPIDKSFNCLITDTGIFYSITVIFKKLNKTYQKVVFYDSHKKLPFSVEVIGEAFELKTRKLKIDYKEYRPVGHQLTEIERDYIIADCLVVGEALKIQFSQGLTKMTNASDAMTSFKKLIRKDVFEKMFPVLPLQLDAEIRLAYKGGFTYLMKRFRNKRVKGGVVLDVNSLYPWAMYNCLLPYGYPMYFEGEPKPTNEMPLFIVRIEVCFELKKKHIPTIQLKNNFAFISTEYLESSNEEIVQITLTNVDLQLFKDHYNILYINYIGGYYFKGTTGIFKTYIDYWMNIKETSKGAIRQLAKLMLNSLYGRFALNPKNFKKYPVLIDGVVKYITVKDEKTAEELGLEPPKPRDPVYTAMGCFITAYAREKTIRTAQKYYDRFIYADTDSLHLVGEDLPGDIEIHPTHLGAWAHEGTFVDSSYIRSKTYIETLKEKKEDTLENYAKLLSTWNVSEIHRETDGIHYLSMNVTCAGMPDNVKKSVTYDNFKSGTTFFGKLVPKHYPGGIILIPDTFTIR